MDTKIICVGMWLVWQLINMLPDSENISIQPNYSLPTQCSNVVYLLIFFVFLSLQTIFNMFKHKPKDAALLDIAIQFVKGTSIFRKLTVHEILWGE